MDAFLQVYWWCIVSLLGGVLVFLMFVQGGQSLLWPLGRTRADVDALLAATGRRWELTFTTLVVFGGAFFASFPLFYSTSFGGAYWVWMLLLFTFVLQAVSYEFRRKAGNLLGARCFGAFLVLNGLLAPLLLGTAVATFFHGAPFVIDRAAILSPAAPVISRWCSAWHGLEAVANPWNVCLGLVVLFLSRTLGCLYLTGAELPAELRGRCRRRLLWEAALFLVFFLPFVAHWLLTDGFAVDPQTGQVFVESGKYLHNLLALPWVAGLLLLGVAAVLAGIALPLLRPKAGGFWWASVGTVAVVMALLLCAGLNNTAYYPSTADLQSSLTLQNSSSGAFTLRTMSLVSLLLPGVIAYIAWAWQALSEKKS